MPLLYVLWTIALLTIIAAAGQLSGSVSYKQIRNVTETVRQEMLAEAALNRAVLALLDKRQNQRPKVDGTPIKFVLEGIEFNVEIQDESGRVDINHADAPLLAGLLRALGESADDAGEIADRILDWRDADDLRRLNGAEAQEYRSAGRSILPRNGPFPSVEELQLVLGMTPPLFQRLEPALTVSSGRPMADPRIALPLIQRALSGNDAARTGSRPTNGGILTGPLEGRAFAIKIGFRLNNRQVHREAVIRVVGAASQPYWLLRWRKHPSP